MIIVAMPVDLAEIEQSLMQDFVSAINLLTNHV